MLLIPLLNSFIDIVELCFPITRPEVCQQLKKVRSLAKVLLSMPFWHVFKLKTKETSLFELHGITTIDVSVFDVLCDSPQSK